MYAVIINDTYALDVQPTDLYLFENKRAALRYFKEAVGIDIKYSENIADRLYGEMCSPLYGFTECSNRNSEIKRYMEECLDLYDYTDLS
jgi:hypothetical protein